MKSVTVREAQHHLARILQSVERGETVEIVRRKVPVARLTPIPGLAADSVDWSDHARRLSEVWGDQQVVGLDETLDDVRGER